MRRTPLLLQFAVASVLGRFRVRSIPCQVPLFPARTGRTDFVRRTVAIDFFDCLNLRPVVARAVSFRLALGVISCRQ